MRNIIVSCLATMFASTWTALHPDVSPGFLKWCNKWFGSGTWGSIGSFLLGMTPLFGLTVVAPELVTGWAIHQRVAANALVKAINDERFTKTHAFFLIMGGFQWRDGEDDRPLGREQFEYLVRTRGLEALELPTEDELNDKSKTDWLGKTIILIQTLWFVVQCIARGIERLPLTELEIITLSYAALTFAIYMVWWNKPRNVNWPVSLPIMPSDKDKILREGGWSGMFFQQFAITSKKKRAAESEKGKGKADSDVEEEDVPDDKRGGAEAVSEEPEAAKDEGDKRDNTTNTESRKVTLGNLPIIIVEVQGTLYLLLAKIHPSSVHVLTITSLLGLIFGGIHCIGWDFHFRSKTDQTLWRASSLTLAISPLVGAYLVCNIYMARLLKKWKVSVMIVGLWATHIYVPGAMFGFAMLSYIPARIITVYVTVHSLLSPSPEVLTDVKWTSFIPHI